MTHSSMQIHYLEIVTPEVDAICATLAAHHGVSFGEPEAGLGHARMSSLHDGGKIGVRKPMHASEEATVRSYLLVDNLEAALKVAVENGGEAIHPPLELPGHGVFAIYLLGGIQHGLWQR